MTIITTFESQCRALASTSSPDEDASRFLVGTLSASGNNLLYLFEYKDDNNSLNKISFKFPFGEIWHLSTSSKYSNLFTAVVGNKNKLKLCLFKLPDEYVNSPVEQDYGLSEEAIEKVFEFELGGRELVRQSRWHPDDGYQLLTCNKGNLNFWDIEQQRQIRTFSLLHATEDLNDLTVKPSQMTDLRWSSLFDCRVVAVGIGSKIYGVDTRISDSSAASICWLTEDQRAVRVRSIDFNPNSQYYIASGGDDCRANFWDLRQLTKPALYMQTHSHWIWSIRYNPFHDQLVLSAGSDSRVALMRAQSVASDPYGQMLDDDEESGDESPGSETKVETDQGSIGDEILETNDFNGRDAINIDKSPDAKLDDKKEKRLGDEVINVYKEHDDSVYAAEWATDPWIFASLGLESRLVINRVPKEEKFNILF